MPDSNGKPTKSEIVFGITISLLFCLGLLSIGALIFAHVATVALLRGIAQ